MSGGDPKDDVLVRRVLGDDRGAYAILVRRYQDRLYRYARGRGLDYDTAADLVQEAFVRAWDRLDRCREPSRFGLWVLSILRNLCIDHARNLRSRTVPLHDDVVPAASDEAERIDARDMLIAAFGALSGDHREAFLLRHRDGLSYDDMADVTGASVSALKMRVHRARDALRDVLQRAGAGPL